MIAAVVAVLSAGVSASAQKAPVVDACSRGGALTPEGIGPLRIGLTPDSLKQVCRVIGERRIAAYGMTQFLIPIGSDTVAVYERAGHVFWIEIDSRSFRTLDSLGVGSPLERLLDLEALDGGVGDGDDAYELNTPQGPQCGLVFWVDRQTAMSISDLARRHPALGNPGPSGLVLTALRQRAKTGTIARIDIRGCAAVRRNGSAPTQSPPPPQAGKPIPPAS